MIGTILWIIVVVLVVLWLLGWLVLHIASPLIHLLIAIAAIVLVLNEASPPSFEVSNGLLLIFHARGKGDTS